MVVPGVVEGGAGQEEDVVPLDEPGDVLEAHLGLRQMGVVEQVADRVPVLTVRRGDEGQQQGRGLEERKENRRSGRGQVE